MKQKQVQQLKQLIASQRVLALSVVVDGEPYVGLLPYAPEGDFRSVLVHASTLARHTRGLKTGASFAILIHEPDAPEVDALQVERVTLQGTVELVDKNTAEYGEGRDLYVKRFPSSEQTFLLGDFNLYRLRIEKGRYVEGFARAVNVGPMDIEQMAT
ncbi:pyridoxamine 5'-phosphate oxidase family protein [Gemmatimonadota bacterium]